MSRGKILAESELKLLVAARFVADQRDQKKLAELIKRELGQEAEKEDPNMFKVNAWIFDKICGVIAQRLSQDQHTVPLLSSEDISPFIPFAVDELMSGKSGKLDPETRKIGERFMTVGLQNILALAQAVPPGSDPYDEYWRWINAVLDLAEKNSVWPLAFLELKNATDQVTRSMYEREQFIVTTRTRMSKLVDADALKQAILQPMLDIIAEQFGEEEGREAEKEVEALFMPQLRTMIERTKTIVETWLNEEADRIYPATPQN
jgi:hypothetical protein